MLPFKLNSYKPVLLRRLSALCTVNIQSRRLQAFLLSSNKVHVMDADCGCIVYQPFVCSRI